MANVRVLAFHGELDISNKVWIEQEFDQLRHAGPHATTILDMTDVRYIDTTFLNALMSVQKHAVDEQADSHLCIAAGKNLSRLFHITALDRLFPVFATMNLAREYAVLCEQ